MPVASTPWHVPRFPKFLIGLIPLGMLLVGWGLSDHISPLSAETGAVTVTSHGVRVVTSTKMVERVVHGKVIHRADKVYIQVPLIVVHTDHHVVKVPAHKLPLRSAAATVANPLVTVQVAVPTTIYVPTTILSTVTSTVTDLSLVTTTVTASIPLTTTSEPPGTG